MCRFLWKEVFPEVLNEVLYTGQLPFMIFPKPARNTECVNIFFTASITLVLTKSNFFSTPTNFLLNPANYEIM